MKQGHILVVDDLEQWREELTETLQDANFLVTSASTADEALQLLDEASYHVLVLDIRMDESDPSNTDGIDLLRKLDKKGIGEAMQVIMLSAHDTKEQVRTAFKDYRVADFLSKDKFNAREFLENVRYVFTHEVNINLSLVIHWQQIKNTDEAVHNLEIGTVKLRRNPLLRERIVAELEDLLCRLFSQAESIMVRPLAQGQSATGVLWVQPFYANGAGRAVVVKFGDFLVIDEEYSNFKRYVQPFIGGGRNTAVLEVRRTVHLGGIVYSLLGVANDALEDFGSFYQHADTEQIKNVLSHLFLDTCGSWYANVGPLHPYDLTEEYQQLLDFTEEKIKYAIQELQKHVQYGTVRGRKVLVFKALEGKRVFSDPLRVLGGAHIFHSSYTCVTHGDFNQHNIFVDGAEHTWLIDFQSTGPGYVFRDIAQMETEVRFSLLQPHDATLEERYFMEEALCQVDRFSQVERLNSLFSTTNPVVAKVYTTIVYLRTLAYKLVPQNINDAMNDYYAALFYNAINTLRMYALPSRSREHALLCASLLSDHFD